jgi:hypothetical protein
MRRTSMKKKLAALVESEVIRLEKLQTYYDYFNVEQRYGLTFKQFVRKVEEGTWQPYLAM